MNNRAFVVGVAAQQVLGRDAGGAIVQADSANAVDVYLGGAYVTADATATGGYRLPAGAALPVEIEGDEDLWAVCASGSPVLRVLTGSRDAMIELG